MDFHREYKAYFSLVRPLTEYASTVWDPYTSGNIDKLEMVQRRAARYVTGRHHNTSSVSDMLAKLQWRPLQARRKDSRLSMLYKIQNHLVSTPAQPYLVPITRHTRHTHSLSYQVPQSRSDYRKFSFFPRTIRDWNSLPPDIPTASTLESFKALVSKQN